MIGLSQFSSLPPLARIPYDVSDRSISSAKLLATISCNNGFLLYEFIISSLVIDYGSSLNSRSPQAQLKDHTINPLQIVPPHPDYLPDPIFTYFVYFPKHCYPQSTEVVLLPLLSAIYLIHRYMESVTRFFNPLLYLKVE